GAVVAIEDHGVGMNAEDLDEANRILAEPPELDAEVVRHLGVQVVRRLAATRGLLVQLRETAGGGTTAIVALPTAVLAAPPAPADEDEPSAPPAAAGSAPTPTATSQPAHPAPVMRA